MGEAGLGRLVSLVVVSIATSFTVPAAAGDEGTGDEEPRQQEVEEPERPSGVNWDPGWPSVGLAEYVVISTAVATVAITSAIGPIGNTRRGGLWIDEDVRDGLRLHSVDSRRRAREASDVMLTFATAYPLLIDSLLVAGWHHDSPEVAWNMAIIDLETLAIVAAMQRLANIVTNRERPYGRTCGSELDSMSQDCDSRDRFYSMFSGHASQTFASAALTCSHHANLPLYGGGPVEALPCVTGFTIASLTATLRVVADRHYLSDVVIGAAIGTAAGFAVPYFYYAHPRQGDESSQASPSWSATVMPTPTGALMQGAF